MARKPIAERTNWPWLIHWTSAVPVAYRSFQVALRKPLRKTSSVPAMTIRAVRLPRQMKLILTR